MQRGRIEVDAGRPHQCARLWIQRDLRKPGRIAKRAKQLTFKHGFEIDHLAGTIFEIDPQHIRAKLLKSFDPLSRMFHGRDLFRTAASLQGPPAGQQVVAVQFGPCFNEPLFPRRQFASNEDYGVDRKNAGRALECRVEVGNVVSFGRFKKHVNADTIKSTDLRH